MAKKKAAAGKKKKVEPVDTRGFLRRVDGIMLAEAQKLADYAAARSQVGVTGKYKKSWKAFTKVDGVIVVNTASYAAQALLGISPKEANDGNQGSKLQALAKWVDVVFKIGDRDKATLIARSIRSTHQQEGSVRWRTGENILDLDPVTKEPRPSSPLYGTAEEIARKINALEV